MHHFKAVASPLRAGKFSAACSVSGHLVIDPKTSLARLFGTPSAVESFSVGHAGARLTPILFKECANALLVHHGAMMLSEDPCYSGSQKTFSLATRFGPAHVTPVDTWVIFRFLEPAGKSFPWGMSGTSGSWNFHSVDEDLGALLEEFAEGLAKCTLPAALSKVSVTERCELLPPTVMKSGAGWYVGCYCKTDEGEWPHSRYSQYFKKPDLAARWLETSLQNGTL